MDEELSVSLEFNNILDDELIVDNDKSIDLSVDYPHLIFKRDDLVRVINLCSKIILVKSDISEYSSISFIKSLYTLNFYVTNELSHFRYEAELIGDLTKCIEEPFSISLAILQKIVRLMGNKVLIYNREGKFYIRLLDGDLLIDARPVRKDIVLMPGDVKDKVAELSLSTFGKACYSILPLISSETINDFKKLYFTGNKMYFKSSFYYIDGDIKTPEMCLSFRDVEFISRLYKYYKDSKIILFSVDTSLSRYRIIMNNIEYQFINSRASEMNLVIDEMNKLIKEPEISIQYDKLYRVINLATNLPGINNTISMKYTSDKLNLNIINNRGTSNFNFSIEKLAQGRLFGKEITLNAIILKRLLSAFSNSQNIDIALDDLGVTIKTDFIRAFLMIYDN